MVTSRRCTSTPRVESRLTTTGPFAGALVGQICSVMADRIADPWVSGRPTPAARAGRSVSTELDLAADLRATADRHRDDQDVHHQSHTFAVAAEQRARRLAPHAERHEVRPNGKPPGTAAAKTSSRACALSTSPPGSAPSPGRWSSNQRRRRAMPSCSPPPASASRRPSGTPSGSSRGSRPAHPRRCWWRERGCQRQARDGC